MAAKTKKAKPKQPEPAVAIQVTDLDAGHHLVGIGNLRVMLVPDGKFWFAQGLEIDYAVQGLSVEDTKKQFERGLYATIEQHLKVYGNINKLLQVAPGEVWQEAVRSKSSIKRYSRLSSHAIKSTAQEALPFEGIDYLVVAEAAACG